MKAKDIGHKIRLAFMPAQLLEIGAKLVSDEEAWIVVRDKDGDVWSIRIKKEGHADIIV